MSFMRPKVKVPPMPEPAPPPNPAMAAITPGEEYGGTGLAPASASLISTASQGLRRRASTQRNSLIGGA